jgi:hypothetical protein
MMMIIIIVIQIQPSRGSEKKKLGGSGMKVRIITENPKN